MAGGITRTTRCFPPSHYLFKIEAFSLLVESKVDKFKSNAFEAWGHQWRFYEMKTEWGFSQLLSQITFNNAANGYLVDDCCTFGAEVLVIRRPPEVQKSVLKKPSGGTITWKMDNFSRLDKEFYKSPVVSIDDIAWYLSVFPRGDARSKDTHLSVFLKLANPHTFPPKLEVYVKFKLRLRNQIKSKHFEQIVEYRFTSSSTNWGYSKFVPLKVVYDSSKGYLVRDGLIVEAEFNLIVKVE
ncbi:hypothetical protein V6N11_019021 [Hibiscus sabdariffa]|uniref:MATH domain-containing protein n=1 Tax=Hibiscus sabdariffa TaxID=183260 RepID=A0ABR2R186_9ROSI